MGYKRRGSNSLPNKAAFPAHLCCKERPRLSLGFPVPCRVNVSIQLPFSIKRPKRSFGYVFLFPSPQERGAVELGARVEVRRHRHFLGIRQSPVTSIRYGNGVGIPCRDKPSYEDTPSVGRGL